MVQHSSAVVYCIEGRTRHYCSLSVESLRRRGRGRCYDCSIPEVYLTRMVFGLTNNYSTRMLSKPGSWSSTEEEYSFWIGTDGQQANRDYSRAAWLEGAKYSMSILFLALSFSFSNGKTSQKGQNLLKCQHQQQEPWKQQLRPALSGLGLHSLLCVTTVAEIISYPVYKYWYFLLPFFYLSLILSSSHKSSISSKKNTSVNSYLHLKHISSSIE